jgi:hypothetical protein
MAVRFHNRGKQTIHVNLEPSGDSFELEPGQKIAIHPAPLAELTIHPDRDLLVEGFPSQVTQGDDELASYTYGGKHAGTKTGSISSVKELRAYLTASGQQIFAEPRGANVFRDVGGKPWVAGVTWSEDNGFALIHGPGVIAKPEQEEALAILLAKINGEIALPGWRLSPSSGAEPRLVVSYVILLFQDEECRLAHTVLDRALDLAFKTCAKYFPRLEAVAQGRPDPG